MRCFLIATDGFIQKHRPDLMLGQKNFQNPWTDQNGQQWVDIFSDDVVSFYLKIINLGIKLGADDINLDYIRFPTEGKVENILSRHNKKNEPRHKSVENLLKQIMLLTNSQKVSLSADIFGIVVWDNHRTNQLLGQEMVVFMRYVDILSPMLYPSHFHNGFNGYENPGDEPYIFMLEGCQKFNKIVSSMPYYHVKQIPWIQAFDYRTKKYDPQYIVDQIKAAYTSNMDGYFGWNAQNNYNTFYKGSQKYNYSL